jgi:hypothetical protein
MPYMQEVASIFPDTNSGDGPPTAKKMALFRRRRSSLGWLHDMILPRSTSPAVPLRAPSIPLTGSWAQACRNCCSADLGKQGPLAAPYRFACGSITERRDEPSVCSDPEGMVGALGRETEGTAVPECRWPIYLMPICDSAHPVGIQRKRLPTSGTHASMMALAHHVGADAPLLGPEAPAITSTCIEASRGGLVLKRQEPWGQNGMGGNKKPRIGISVRVSRSSGEAGCVILASFVDPTSQHLLELNGLPGQTVLRTMQQAL